MSTIDDQVAAFEAIRPNCERFSEKLKGLLEDLATGADIPFHLIEGRAKSLESFREKLTRPGKSYKNGLQELPDLCGCRIITYYQDDCDKIAEIIRSEFEIIEEELSHQPSKLQADQFGYISAHYIVKIGPSRSGLGEWKKFEGLRCEIQVRTVIQHAWSAVSHALQYKTETEVPSKLQRRLYRIAGLFELADEEFSAIRDQRKLIRGEVSLALGTGHLEIALSLTSVEEFLNQWPEGKKVTAEAEKAGFDIYEGPDEELSGDILDFTNKIGINTVKDLEQYLIKSDFRIFKYIFDGQSEISSWDANLQFLCMLLLITNNLAQVSVDYLVSRGWGKIISEDIIASISKFLEESK